VAVGTDSSGELFVNGDANWASDVSQAKNSVKEREEKENLLGVGNVIGNLDSESGYGSEPGYRGDAEFGYGDRLMRKRMMPGCCFGDTTFKVHAHSFFYSPFFC
jgi:hypothetical protein